MNQPFQDVYITFLTVLLYAMTKERPRSEWFLKHQQQFRNQNR